MPERRYAEAGMTVGATAWVWPDYYPDNCPPRDALRCAGVVYRLTAPHPGPEDFKPHLITLPNPVRPYSCRCQAAGLSVYTVVDDVRLAARMPGPRKRGLVVAKGELDAACGVIKATPRDENSHHTWWLPSDVDPSGRFCVQEQATYVGVAAPARRSR